VILLLIGVYSSYFLLGLNFESFFELFFSYFNLSSFSKDSQESTESLFFFLEVDELLSQLECELMISSLSLALF